MKWAALVLVLLWGCASKPGERTRHPDGLSPAQRFGVAEGSPGLSLLGGQDRQTVLVAAGAGVAGDRVAGLLEIPDDQCAVVIARSGESIEDLDLMAYGEDGSVVGTDEKPDARPALLICPPHPQRIWVSARIAGGHGLVAVGAERVLPRNAERVAALYGAGSGEVSLASRAFESLDDQLLEHQREIGAEWHQIRRFVVPLDSSAPTRVAATIEAGRCLDAFLSPSDEVGHIGVEAIDPSGAIVGRADDAGRQRFIVVCAPNDTPLTLELRPRSGRGMGVLTLSGSRPGSETTLDDDFIQLKSYLDRTLDQELQAVGDALTELGYAAGKVAARGTLAVGTRTTLSLSLARGCSRLDVVGGAPLRGIAAWAWSKDQHLLARSKRSGHARLFVCGPGGSVRLDLEATLRPGPFAVLEHAELDTPQELSRAPLAASRLLHEVVEHGVLQRAAQIGRVHDLSLSDVTLETLDLTVPFGRCVNVALALGEDALGAEVRLVAMSNGSEIGYARGPHAASAQVCSLDASSAKTHLKTRAEFRVAVGSGRALVATRMLSPAR